MSSVQTPEHWPFGSTLVVSDHNDTLAESCLKVSARWPAVANVAACCPFCASSIQLLFPSLSPRTLSGDLHILLLMPSSTCFSTVSMFRIPQQVFCDCLSSCLYLSTHLCGNHRRPSHKCPWCLSTHGTCIHDASTSATESFTHLLLPSRVSSKEVPEPLLFCHGFSRVGTR